MVLTYSAVHDLQVIVNGLSREDMTTVYAMLKARTKQLDAQNTAAVRVGSRVKIENIRPKELNGQIGVVTGYFQGRFGHVNMELENPVFVPRRGIMKTLTGIPTGCLVTMD